MCPNHVPQVAARSRPQVVEDRAVSRPERVTRRPIDHPPVILWDGLVPAKPADEHRRRRTRARRVERDPFAVLAPETVRRMPAGDHSE
jgi:hypothetical protein